MRKGSGRRRVKIADDDGEAPTIVARSTSGSVRKKSKLSFSNDLDGEEEGGMFGMKGAAVRREEDEDVGIVREKKTVVLGDLVSRPSYGKEDLKALQSDVNRVEEPVVVIAGDELDMMEQEQEQDGEEDISIPMVEQIRVAREIRERLRKQGEDFIPLNEEAEEEGRLVRDKSDDSDEPFEEHRGPKIKFGAPTGPERPSKSSSAPNLNDSVVNDWELELIRCAAGVDAPQREEILPEVRQRHRVPRDIPILSAG
jgi:hypothetical protein